MSESLESLSREQVMERLSIGPAVLSALLNSGLLGPHDGSRIPAIGVEHFERYGTQWREELGPRRYKPSDIPVPEDVGREQPASTVTQLQISPVGLPHDAAESDTSWVVQFYFRPNLFYFPSAFDSSPVGPIPIELAERVQISGMPYVTTLYPDPTGRLAMVMLSGPTVAGEDPYRKAYDAVLPLVAELSFRADVPLPIVHAFVVGVPSGVVTIQIPKPSKDVKLLDLSIRNPMLHDGLLDAKALYFEALSTPNPFYQFLGFWKVYEYVVAARGDWRRKHKRPDVKVRPERLPEVWVWRQKRGQTFEVLLNGLRDDYRNAIAHADPRIGLRSAASSSDWWSVSASVPVLRYVARTVLENFEATLEQAAAASGSPPKEPGENGHPAA